MSEDVNPRDVVRTMQATVRALLAGHRRACRGDFVEGAREVHRAVDDLAKLNQRHRLDGALDAVLVESTDAAVAQLTAYLASAGWPVHEGETPQAALVRAVQAAKAGGEAIDALAASLLPRGSVISLLDLEDDEDPNEWPPLFRVNDREYGWREPGFTTEQRPQPGRIYRVLRRGPAPASGPVEVGAVVAPERVPVGATVAEVVGGVPYVGRTGVRMDERATGFQWVGVEAHFAPRGDVAIVALHEEVPAGRVGRRG